MKATLSSRIRCASPADRTAVLALLQAAALPTSDLPSAQDLQFWLLERDGRAVGVVGLERFGRAALLRSLAIGPEHRRQGLGQELVAMLEEQATQSGIEQLVLLTETAQGFFQRLGYTVIERGAAPTGIQQSSEFQSLCPVSAICMGKVLSGAR